MSGDNLRRMTTDTTVGETPDEQLTPLGGTDRPEVESGTIPEPLLSSVIEDVADGDLTVDDGLVTQSLDEILLAMIALADDETHGTGLMEELSRLFDADLSPGTVYPRLHDLEAESQLRMHELVQTKQYSIDDAAAAESKIEDAMYQHLAIGLFLHASLDNV
ncbi:PadR family transcriptional regulator [Haloarcula montana]|uniref:PadR family transcriptional regulator n=1 Tax=Haloarcula montana TaxID=3111776 RepID=UPI002D7A2F71|nr:helix-turn-helix transcriptional regulator [Haloarcula sp. GH36]